MEMIGSTVSQASRSVSVISQTMKQHVVRAHQAKTSTSETTRQIMTSSTTTGGGGQQKIILFLRRGGR